MPSSSNHSMRVYIFTRKNWWPKRFCSHCEWRPSYDAEQNIWYEVVWVCVCVAMPFELHFLFTWSLLLTISLRLRHVGNWFEFLLHIKCTERKWSNAKNVDWTTHLAKDVKKNHFYFSLLSFWAAHQFCSAANAWHDDFITVHSHTNALGCTSGSERSMKRREQKKRQRVNYSSSVFKRPTTSAPKWNILAMLSFHKHLSSVQWSILRSRLNWRTK